MSLRLQHLPASVTPCLRGQCRLLHSSPWNCTYFTVYNWHLKAMIPLVCNVNANYEWRQQVEHIKLVHKWFHSSECECELRMRQNESLHVAIGADANVLTDQKSIHSLGRSRVAHAAWREKLHWFPNCIRHSHSAFTFGERPSGNLA